MATPVDPAKAAEEVAYRGAMIVLTFIVVLAAYLRLHDLTADSIWRDETTSLAQSSGGILHIISATAQDNYPPLHNFILALVVKLFGDSPWALRFPSAILGIAAVPALYWVGSMIAGRVAGLVAAFLLAASPFAIHYSQEARPYAVLMLAAILFAGTTLAFVRKASRGWAATTFLSGVALLYSHPYGTLTWLALAAAATAIVVLWPQAGGATLLRWMLLQLATVVAFAPWLAVLLSRIATLHQSGFWIPYPSLIFVLVQLQNVAGGTLGAVPLVALAALAFVQPAAAGNAVPPQSTPAPLRFGATASILLVLSWLVLPVVAALVISFVALPIVYDRYLICCLPALLLLAGVGLSRFVTRFSTGLLATGVAVLVAVLGISFGSPPPREDWRGLSAYIATNLHPGDCVLFVDRDSAQAVEYYLHKPLCELYPRTFPTTVADRVIAVRSGNYAAIDALLNSPGWSAGKPVDFNAIAAIPLTRAPS
ncbi:MAG TPA: glycosyltransferase family 39 protein [Bauldia sp.]|nr:glycosyltransferase family 39 protein [Bauldia sp.]